MPIDDAAKMVEDNIAQLVTGGDKMALNTNLALLELMKEMIELMQRFKQLESQISATKVDAPVYQGYKKPTPIVHPTPSKKKGDHF